MQRTVVSLEFIALPISLLFVERKFIFFLKYVESFVEKFVKRDKFEYSRIVNHSFTYNLQFYAINVLP